MGTMASRILGLFRDLAMAALFDRTITDAWAAAFRLPNFFRRLLGEGSLSAAFVPEWQKHQHSDSRVAQDFVNQSFLLVAMLLIFISLGLIFGAEPLLRMLLDGAFVNNSFKFALTVKMAQIMGAFVLFSGLSALLSALLQLYGEFGWTGLAPLFFNVGMLIFTFIPVGWFQGPGMGLAWGVLVGGIAQFSLLAWRFRKRGLSWSLNKIDLSFLMPFLKSIPSGFIAVGLLQFLLLVNSYLASGLEPGTLSRLYWADRLLELPMTLVAVSLGTALLPLLSQLHLENRKLEFSGYVEQNLLYGALFILPAAGGLWALSNCLVRLLFYRGEFDLIDLSRTSAILKYSAWILIFHSLYRILLPVFLAQAKTRWIFRTMVISLAFHLSLAPWAVARGQLAGLLILTIGTLAIAAGILLGIYLKEHSWGQHESAGKEIVKILAASLFMTAFLALLEERFILAGRAAQAGSILLGLGIYVIFLIWLRSRTLRLFWKRIKSRKVNS